MNRRLNTKTAAYRKSVTPRAIPAIAPTPRPDDDDDDDVDAVGEVVLEVPSIEGNFVSIGAVPLGTRLGTALLIGRLVKGGKESEGLTSRTVLKLGRGDDREGNTDCGGLLEGTRDCAGDVLGSSLTDALGVTNGAGETLGTLEGWPLFIGICDSFGVVVGGKECLGETEGSGHIEGRYVRKDVSAEGSLVEGGEFGAVLIDGDAGTLKVGRGVTICVVDAILDINGSSSDGCCVEEMNDESVVMLWTNDSFSTSASSAVGALDKRSLSNNPRRRLSSLKDNACAVVNACTIVMTCEIDS